MVLFTFLCFGVATVTMVTTRSRYADSMKLRPFVYLHGFSRVWQRGTVQFRRSSGGVRPLTSHSKSSITGPPQNTNISLWLVHLHLFSLLCWVFSGPSSPITPISHNQTESGLIIKKNNQGRGISCVHWCVFFVFAHNGVVGSREIVTWFQVSLLLISLLYSLCSRCG